MGPADAFPIIHHGRSSSQICLHIDLKDTTEICMVYTIYIYIIHICMHSTLICIIYIYIYVMCVYLKPSTVVNLQAMAVPSPSPRLSASRAHRSMGGAKGSAAGTYPEGGVPKPYQCYCGWLGNHGMNHRYPNHHRKDAWNMLKAEKNHGMNHREKPVKFGFRWPIHRLAFYTSLWLRK